MSYRDVIGDRLYAHRRDRGASAPVWDSHLRFRMLVLSLAAATAATGTELRRSPQRAEALRIYLQAQLNFALQLGLAREVPSTPIAPGAARGEASLGPRGTEVVAP